MIFTTGAFTTPFVSAPFTVAAPWTKLVFTVNIVLLAGAMRVLLEYSTDGGASWQKLTGETGVVASLDKQGVPRTREDFTSEWSRPFPPGLLKVTLAGPTPWDCPGVQVDLT